MSNEAYRVTWISHLRQGWPFFLYSLLLVGVPLYVHYRGVKDLRVAVVSAIAFFCLFFIPHLLIHLRYAWVSRKMSISFDKNNSVLSINDGRTVKVFRLNDIKSTALVLPGPLAHDEAFFYPWQIYGYATIVTYAGQKNVVTSLLVPDLRFPVDLPNAVVHKRFYCWPPKNEQ